jgi:hypothetical protein
VASVPMMSLLLREQPQSVRSRLRARNRNMA